MVLCRHGGGVCWQGARSAQERVDVGSWEVTPEKEEAELGSPAMMDVLSGPNAPLASAFRMCGWQAETLDRAICASDDLNSEARQRKLASQTGSAAFVAVAFDCNTKSRVREIPREFEDGRRAPEPLRPEDYPEWLPSLSGAAEIRVK